MRYSRVGSAFVERAPAGAIEPHLHRRRTTDASSVEGTASERARGLGATAFGLPWLPCPKTRLAALAGRRLVSPVNSERSLIDWVGGLGKGVKVMSDWVSLTKHHIHLEGDRGMEGPFTHLTRIPTLTHPTTWHLAPSSLRPSHLAPPRCVTRHAMGSAGCRIASIPRKRDCISPSSS